ncbi:glycine cleavage system aminomethyltransferase GcvT [Pseudothermotoga thermarum]|uniref:Aminomethyltransferase n=1 Tax=Pseudothermotoga thermarum DSM 5069 TaxID=688269 RepID=F7YWE6_9THEM|nr:glycine cleavage system aminomethyltransferase GcvT [Pseudothermotoga thermarum]AEH51924.1 aminomethyltransferase [Pseudothermotoga thermarum DSM 5069]
MNKTPLYESHLSLGAKMVDFAGWLMPLQYEGITAEVMAVRRNVAVFDVSHMGEIIVEGEDTAKFLDHILTNNFSTLKVGQVVYSVMCNQNGGIIDDLLAYRLGENKAMLVVNAANTKKDYEWIVQNAKNFKVTVKDESFSFGLIAVQGPTSESFLSKYLPDLSTLGYYSFASYVLFGKNCLVSRTGYTGEDGFEIYCKWEETPFIWEQLLDRGKEFGIKPAGLGARDVCRLEASYMLYGNDIDETVTPLEAGLGWTVKFEKDFIGKESLLKQKENGVKRRIRGLKLDGRRIARHGMKVYKDGVEIGYITSGTFSPTLEESIAFGMLYGDLKVGDEVQVDVRGSMVLAKIVKLPFYRGTVKSR